jgi:Protein of unknown function (DUF1153)
MPTVQHGSERSEPRRAEMGSGQTAGSGAILVSSQGDRSAVPPLPSSRTRWVAQRKAEVVQAVLGGVLTLDEARERYALSIEEFLTWQHGISLFGLAGLRVYGVPGRESAKLPSVVGRTGLRLHRKAARNPMKRD